MLDFVAGEWTRIYKPFQPHKLEIAGSTPAPASSFGGLNNYAKGRGLVKTHNPFWRNTRTEKHRTDDPLDTAPVVPAIVTPVGKRFTCVGCGCTMTANGEDIWKLGEGYKEWKEAAVKHAKAIEKKDEEITALRAELTAVKTERDALKGSSGAPSGRRLGSRIQ